MLSAKATVLPAAAATGQLQRRTPCLAPWHAAAGAGRRPAALSCSPSHAACLASASAPRRNRSRHVSARAGGGSDLESEALEEQSFSHLAKAVANKLAETAGQEGAFNRLTLWLDQAAGPAKRAVEQTSKGNVGEAKEEVKQAKSVLGKAASLAASALGMSGFMKGAGGDDSPAATAARALGADSVNITVEAVKEWLTSPHRKGDVQMVGALVYKMLSFLEHETGERFEGKDHQYKWLSRLAMEVFGGSMTSRLVRALVDAYLRAPSRG